MFTKALKIAALLALGMLLLSPGKPEQKEANASPVAAPSYPDLSSEVSALAAEVKALQSANVELQKQVQSYKASAAKPVAPPPRPTYVAAPRKSAATGCAGGVCRVQAASSRSYQPQTYRSGPIRRLFGR